MAEGNSDWIKPGTRVNVKDKGLHGTVRFFGNTDFAPGKWVGVELDEQQGKNNGIVKGKVSTLKSHIRYNNLSFLAFFL